MATHVQAGPDVVRLAGEVMAKYHPDLAEAGVTLCLLMAAARVDGRTGEPRGPAVTLHGYPCKATIKVNSEKDRVEGKADLTVTIDAAAYDDMAEAERVSLLDHELEHAVLLREKDGAVRTDDAGRPRVKLRPHDFQLGGFVNVCDRHKQHAHEAQAFADVHRLLTQKVFPWG